MIKDKKTIYRKEVKEFIQQQAQLGLTTKELKERCNTRFPEYDFSDQKIRDFIRNNQIQRVKPEKENNVMTAEERAFAEKNINVIYDYLNRNGLDVEYWFDVVVFGYLNAVMNYSRVEKLKQYAFTTIAWRAMKATISNHIVYERAEKRPREVVSLDRAKAETETGEGLNEVIPDYRAEMQFREAEFMHDIKQHTHEKLNEEQRKQCYLMCLEYKDREIIDILKIDRRTMRKNKSYIQLVFSKSGVLSFDSVIYRTRLLRQEISTVQQN